MSKIELSLEHKTWMSELIQEVFEHIDELKYTECFWKESAGYVHLYFKDLLRPSIYVMNNSKSLTSSWCFNKHIVFSTCINNISCQKDKESLKQYILNNMNKEYTKYIKRLDYGS